MFPTFLGILLSNSIHPNIRVMQDLNPLGRVLPWTLAKLIVADDRRYDSYCDYRKVNRDEEEEEEEEDTFSCLKSPETSGGCCYGSVPLWHQAANLVSKPLWVC